MPLLYRARTAVDAGEVACLGQFPNHQKRRVIKVLHRAPRPQGICPSLRAAVTSVTGVQGAERYTHEREGHDPPGPYTRHDLLHSLFCGLGADRRLRTELP